MLVIAVGIMNPLIKSANAVIMNEPHHCYGTEMEGFLMSIVYISIDWQGIYVHRILIMKVLGKQITWNTGWI